MRLSIVSLLTAVILLLVSGCMDKKMDNPMDPIFGTEWAYMYFYPSPGSYDSFQQVRIVCYVRGIGYGVPGFTIRYTTNGSTPTASSAVYSSPISVTKDMIIKARAFKEGWKDSEVATAQYYIAVATPVFEPPAGTYNDDQLVTISCRTSDATIRYTTDGTEPTASSTLYSTPITVNKVTVLKARAFKSGWPESFIATAEYTFKVATPTFSHPGGNYNIGQQISISCATSGASIRYTINGGDPTHSSELYTSPITLNHYAKIKAKAFFSGWVDSDVNVATYTITPPELLLSNVQGGTLHNGVSSVTLSGFYISKHEITQKEYQMVMGTNPGYTDNPNHPVAHVTWCNAIEYCNRLSKLHGFTPCYSYESYGTNLDDWPANWNTSSSNHTKVSCSWTANGYRLPTEMEWEFAARGANLTQGFMYSGSNNINTVAWYTSNSDYTAHQVGTKAANELGIFDMSGNVFEWCWDIYGDYPSGDQTNPHGATSGSYRVMRGGSYNSVANDCNVSSRFSNYATTYYSYLGFRCVRNAP